MDDRNRDDVPRRGYILRRFFRRFLLVLRYLAVNICSCRFFVSLLLFISSLALLRMGCNNSSSTRNNADILRNSTDSLTNLADFEAGVLVRRRNSNNADALDRLLEGETEHPICESVNISTMMSILYDGIPRECVHSDAADPNINCLQCATERFQEICEQQARELQSYNRLHTVHLLPDEHTSLLSQENQYAFDAMNSENSQLPDKDKNENRSVDHSESSAAAVCKPDLDNKVSERQNNTWLDISVVSPDSFDGLYVSEVTIRGLDCDDTDNFDDFHYLDNIELEINAPYRQDVERVANAPSRQDVERVANAPSREDVERVANAPSREDLELEASAAVSHSMRDACAVRQENSSRSLDPIQSYHEVLSGIRSLINLPYQNQCPNKSSARNLQSPSTVQHKTEQPSPATGAIPKNRDVRPAIEQESPAKEQVQPEPPSATGAIPKNWNVIRKLRKGAESGGESRSFNTHSSSSRSTSYSRNTDTVITNPYAGAIPRNLDIIQSRNDRQSWASESNSMSFEIPQFSSVTDHEAPTSYGPSRHYTSNILRAASDLNPRLILVADAADDSDDDAVVEYDGEIIDTDDDDVVVKDNGEIIDSDDDAVIEDHGEIIDTDDDDDDTLV